MNNTILKFIVIVGLFLALIIIITYPLVLNIKHYLPAFFSTDETYGVLWYSWLTKFSLMHNLSIKYTDFIAYPFGIDLKFFGYLFFFINYVLSVFTTPLLTYNLQILFNFFMSALLTFLLVRYLTKNTFSAFLSGVIFGFCPYLFVRSWQHLGETYVWIMPNVLLWLILLRDNPTKLTKTFFVISLILTSIGVNFLYTGMALMVFFVFLSFYYLKNKSVGIIKEKLFIRNIILLTLITFALLLPQAYPIFKGVIKFRNTVPTAQNPYLRPFEDLFIQSAKPLSYLLPPSTHPVFGKFTEQFIGSQLYGISFTEHTLYLGWVPLVLAFIAFRKWKRNKNLQVMNEEGLYIGFFVSLAIISWLFSQPPWWKIGPVKILMPSFFVYKILPMFRAYSRFGFVVMFAVSVLAGFGLKFILERFKSQKKKTTITALFCMLVLFEFWNYPPFKVMDITRVPAVYYWIKEQPQEFVIAEYPLDIIGPSEIYKFYQITHQRKIINSTLPGTYAHKIIKTITKLSEYSTAAKLKWLGVRYVLVHKEDYLKTELVEDREELNKIPGNSGLKFIKGFPPESCPNKDIACIQRTGPIDVYEVVALPIKPSLKEKGI